MKANFHSRFLAVAMALYLLGTLPSCNSAGNTSLANKLQKSDTAEVRQAVKSFYDFIMTKDLSDSLVFNQWMSMLTNDVVWLSAKGVAPSPVDFGGYRNIFKNNKAYFDQLTIDRVDASSELAYVLYHFHEVVKAIKTNEVVADDLYSAVVALKKDATGKWKIALLRYKG